MTPHIPYCFYINLTSVERRLPLLFYRLRSYGLKRISISFRVTKTLKGRAEMHIRSCDTKFRELFLVCFFFKFHHVMGVEFQFSIYLVGCFEDKVAFHVCFTLFYDLEMIAAFCSFWHWVTSIFPFYLIQYCNTSVNNSLY